MRRNTMQGNTVSASLSLESAEPRLRTLEETAVRSARKARVGDGRAV